MLLGRRRRWIQDEEGEGVRGRLGAPPIRVPVIAARLTKLPNVLIFPVAYERPFARLEVFASNASRLSARASSSRIDHVASRVFSGVTRHPNRTRKNEQTSLATNARTKGAGLFKIKIPPPSPAPLTSLMSVSILSSSAARRRVISSPETRRGLRELRRSAGRPGETRRLALRLQALGSRRSRASRSRTPPVHLVQLVGHRLHVRPHSSEAVEDLGQRRHHAVADAVHHQRLPALHEHHLPRRAVVARAYRPRGRGSSSPARSVPATKSSGSRPNSRAQYSTISRDVRFRRIRSNAMIQSFALNSNDS